MRNKFYLKNGLRMQPQNKCPMEVILTMTGVKAMVINFGDQDSIVTVVMGQWDNFA